MEEEDGEVEEENGRGRGGEGGIVPVNMPPSISLSLISGTPIKTLSHCNQCTRVLFHV